MMPDPDTAKGKAEIERILKKRRAEAEAARKRSEEDVDGEPTGKMTRPDEMNIRRDRKSGDE